MHPFLYMKAYTTVRHNADLSNSYFGILIKKYSINMDLEIKWIEICLEIELKHKKWQISMILLTVYFQNTSSTSADVIPSIFTETIPLIIWWYVTVCVFSNKTADFLYKWYDYTVGISRSGQYKGRRKLIIQVWTEPYHTDTM